MFSVYCHTNSNNGKTYVGITEQDPEKRWLNGKGYSKNEKFYSDILLYGWDGFEHRIVADQLTEEQAVAIEKELISAYDSRGLGYNNSDGGKYVSKRSLCHYANEVKAGIVHSKYESICKNILDTFALAEKSGKNSSICKGVNDCVNAIIDTFKNDERPLNYSDPFFLVDFSWEWNRYWKIAQYYQTHKNEQECEIMESVKKLFPKYNTQARWKCYFEKIAAN